MKQFQKLIGKIKPNLAFEKVATTNHFLCFSSNSTFFTFDIDDQDISNETDGVINPTDDTTEIEDHLSLVLDPTNTKTSIYATLKDKIFTTMNETTE